MKPQRIMKIFFIVLSCFMSSLSTAQTLEGDWELVPPRSCLNNNTINKDPLNPINGLISQYQYSIIGDSLQINMIFNVGNGKIIPLSLQYELKSLNAKNDSIYEVYPLPSSVKQAGAKIFQIIKTGDDTLVALFGDIPSIGGHNLCDGGYVITNMKKRIQAKK